MAHAPEWHREYLRLENAEAVARAVYRAARKGAARDTALDALRVAGAARFNFEMAAAKIIDIATLPPLEFARALFPRAGT